MSEGIQGKEIIKLDQCRSAQRVVSKVHGVSGVAAAKVPQVEALLASTAAYRYVESYSTCLAQSLTQEKVKAILAELEHIASAGGPKIARVSQVYFLAHIFSSFIEDLQSNKTASLQNGKARSIALNTLINRLSETQYLTTTVCTSLNLATESCELGQEAALEKLLKFIFQDSSASKKHQDPILFELEVVALSVAVCSGWIAAEFSPGLNLAAHTLVSHLKKLHDLQQASTDRLLSDCLTQTIILTLTTSKTFTDSADLKQLAKERVHFLGTMASRDVGDSSSNVASGMAERLSPAGSDVGIGVTNMLADLGPACTQSASTLRETLRGITRTLPPVNGGGSELKALDEEALARLIYFFSERGTRKNVKGGADSSSLVGTLTNDFEIEGVSEWKLDTVSQVISEDFPQADWVSVSEKFDFAGFSIRDISHLNALLSLYRSGSKSTFPLATIVSSWQNQSGQLSLLEHLLAVTPSVFTFAVNEAEAADAATVTDGSSSACVNPQGWASADVLQRLLQLSDVQNLARRVRDLFVKGLLSCPEVLLCALVRLQLNVAQKGNEGIANVGMQMKGELMRELIPLFFKPNPHHRVQNGPSALRRLWSISPNTVAAACIEAWRSSSNESPQSRLATVVHVISIIRLLPSPETATATILNGNKDNEFSIAVAFIMADNDMLQLRPWLKERVSSGGSVLFLVGIIAYIGKTYTSVLPRASATNNNDGKGAPLVSIENLTIALQFIQDQDSSLLGQEIPHAFAPVDPNSSSGMTIGESVKAIVEACVRAYPAISSSVSRSPTGMDPSSGSPTPASQSADDIEEMANSYFQKIYTSEQSIGEVVNMLKRFKTSGNARENDIFACMIHNLFDEYRFFSKYPEKELRITGILFGMLIQHQLVSSITLGIALRYVLEALRKPPSPHGTTSNTGKMFRFGMFALEQFKERLHEWPQYCSHIVQIPHLKQGYAGLVAEIEGAMTDNQNRNVTGSSVSSTNSIVSDKSGNATVDGQKSISSGVPSSVDIRLNTPSEGTGVVGRQSLPNEMRGAQSGPSEISLTPSALPFVSKAPQNNIPLRTVAVFGPGLGRAVNDQKEGTETQHEAPPDAILDRVQFLINNVTMSNVEQKALDLKDMLASQYFGWLGHYLVVKRISTQPNFHSVYLAFLDQLGDYGKGLVEAILSSVYLNVGKLLRSKKITTSTSERSLLKNLGSWLGQITLARNRPILQITLDCKELLFQGYETGMLIAVTPFVAKILEGAKTSVVFRPPNPWLMGLLSVFRALYGVDDLKMNIKFEVEVLCKNLGVKLEDIPLRTEDLAKRLPPVKTRNPDFNTKSSMTSQTPVPSVPSVPSSNGQALSGPSTPSKLPDGKQVTVRLSDDPAGGSNAPFGSVRSPSNSAGSPADQQQTVIPNLAAYVTISQNLGSGTVSSATLKRTVPVAVDRAIREIIQPVVERSVTIACITTKEIVSKDFAMESDENKMRKAAQLMVANLAGSLALVTCREPLRASVSTHLRQLLVSSVGGSSASGSTATSSTQLSEQDQSIIEHCVGVCAADNLELGCILIEKAATEKAARDMDESLGPALTTRKKHREQTGQPFYDMSIFGNGGQRYPAALPEPLRPKPGGLRNEQLLVYEAFQRMPRQPTVPTAQQQNSASSVSPSSSGGAGGSSASSTGVSSKIGGAKINVETLSAIAGKLDSGVTALLATAGPRAPEVTLAMLPPDHEIKQLLLAAKQITSSASSAGTLSSAENDGILGFAQGIFKRLYELSLSEPLRLEAFVAMLEALNQCCRQLEQDLGTWATYAPTETDAQRKLHRTVLLLLLRSCLIEVSELDEHLCRSMDNGRNLIWLEFTLLFVRTAVLEKIVNPKELPKVIGVLAKVGEGAGQNNQVTQLLRLIEEMAGSSVNNEAKGRSTPDNVAATVSGLNALVGKPDKPTHQQSSSISAASLTNLAEATKRAAETIDTISREDPAGLKQQVMVLLDGWMRINSDINGSDKTLHYIQLLQQNGVGENEEQTERFFRVSTEILVEAVLKSANSGDINMPKNLKESQRKSLNYGVIDSYAKLLSLLIRHMNSGGSSDQIANARISLLNKILGITVRTMMAHYERSVRESGLMSPNWDQRPWFRLMLNLVIDLNSPSPTLDPIGYGILSVFGSAFHVIQPLVVPGFAFAWLELISHRMFLSNLLLMKGQKGWALAHQLLIDLFLFLEPHLRRTEMTEAMKYLYKGILRVLLVLLHDFPAFLAGYHLSFCNVIPENCVQLRNLILSAFPRGMVLPDPFTPNLKIDLLPEISKNPVVLSNVAGPLSAIRSELDNYLKNPHSSDFLQELLPRLCKDGSKEIDAPRVNALVLYVGIQGIARLHNSQISHALAHTPEMEILQKLMEFNDSGRYISLNAIANQLRYPSSHTHYYSCVMLSLFSEAKDEGVREQVTRVLLERLIVHRPHPWGLLITFIELIKNQRYQFWSHPFTRCATEIEKVFESVARSCMTPGSQRTGAVGVGDVSQ